MLFNTAAYAVFFIVFFALFQLSTTSRVAKLSFIAVGSIIFYAGWDYRYVPLLVGTGLVDFFIARALDTISDQRRRRALLAGSISLNLGVLFFFKYSGFTLTLAQDLAKLFGAPVLLPTVSFVLPVGVSFYTFQSISYTVDVYRGHFKPKQRFSEFLASLTFFPHLVAGPIIRSSFLLPQFEKFEQGTDESHRRAFVLISFGLLKKSIADLLGRTSDAIFGSGTQAYSGLDAWSGALAFTGQIYCDFSGYTDIAIGSALLLGFVIPDNFNLPFLSSSPTDFWKRWHISLSNWLRDYLFVPLGRRHRRFNLFLTMVLGGLWHGAGLTYIVWGAYHGGLLVVNHVVSERMARRPTTDTFFSRAMRVGGIVGTFYLMMIGWVLFRADSLGRAWAIIRDMHWPSRASVWSHNEVVTIALVVFALVFSHLLDGSARTLKGFIERPLVLWPLTSVALCLSILLSSSTHAFIYFQF